MELFRPTVSTLWILWQGHVRNVLFDFCQLWAVSLLLLYHCILSVLLYQSPFIARGFLFCFLFVCLVFFVLFCFCFVLFCFVFIDVLTLTVSSKCHQMLQFHKLYIKNRDLFKVKTSIFWDIDLHPESFLNLVYWVLYTEIYHFNHMSLWVPK